MRRPASPSARRPRYAALRRFLGYGRPYWKRVALALLCMALEAAAINLMVLVAKDTLQPLLRSEALAASASLHRLKLLGAAFFGLGLLEAVAFFGHYYLTNYVGQRMILGLRQDLFSHLTRLSLRFFEDQQSGRLVSHLTNDVQALQEIFSENVAQVVVAPLIAAGALCVMLFLSWRLTLLVLLGAPLLAWLIQRAGRRMRRVTQRMQSHLADLTALFQEVIAGIRIVQCFTAEGWERRRFREDNERTAAAVMKGHQLHAVLNPTVRMTGAVALLLLLWAGAREIMVAQRLQGENLLALLALVQITITQLRKFSRLHLTVQRSNAVAQRIFEVLDLQPDIIQRPDAVVLARVEGRVEFEEVSFRYPSGEVALRGVSLAVRPGEVVALAGPSGAGKTTLANLIPRLYDVTQGAVRVDGHDVRDLDLYSLRSHIGIVPQETILFSGTVRDNIAYGRLEAGEEEVEWAARMAHAHEFIQRLPQGYRSIVGERGSKLSGGQRQRLAIARALLRDPRILVLDEATSALDSESEALVQEALERLMEGRTTLIIAHRLSTIQNADRVVVLDEGCIVESGPHAQLVAGGGLYSKLYELQHRDHRAPAAAPPEEAESHA